HNVDGPLRDVGVVHAELRELQDVRVPLEARADRPRPAPGAGAAGRDQRAVDVEQDREGHLALVHVVFVAHGASSIRAALAGPPSPPSIRSGMHTSRYAPGSIEERSRPSMITTPSSRSVRWVGWPGGPRCSIDRKAIPTRTMLRSTIGRGASGGRA